MIVSNRDAYRMEPVYDNLPIIDMEIVEELRRVGGNDELLQRVLTLFGLHVPKSMAKVQQYAAEGDLDELADAVHALKSMCGNIGARRVTALCEEMERRVRMRDIDFDTAEKTTALVQEVEAVLREAERLKTH